MSRWIKSSHLGFGITPKSNKTSWGLRNPLGTFLPSLQTSHVVVMEKPKIVIGFLITSKRHNTSSGPLKDDCVEANLKVENVKSLRLTFWSEKKSQAKKTIKFQDPTPHLSKMAIAAQHNSFFWKEIIRNSFIDFIRCKIKYPHTKNFNAHFFSL